jgi:hypothetical protein
VTIFLRLFGFPSRKIAAELDLQVLVLMEGTHQVLLVVRHMGLIAPQTPFLDP